MKLLIIIALAFCAACSIGGKRPNYQYYVLTTKQATPTPHAPPADKPRRLAVDDVVIPGYLDRDEIATRKADHQLEYSHNARWAEPLDQAFQRTLRESLAAQLARTSIEVEAGGGSPTYDLDVDVLRFEQSGPDHVELSARWTLSSGRTVLDRGETHLRVAMRGFHSNAMASALSDAIDRMATEIADRVQEADVVATRDRKR